MILPDNNAVKHVLDNCYPYSKTLYSPTSDFKKDWTFTKRSGWLQKVHDGKKALHDFIPLDKAFNISVAIRSHEKTDFLNDPDLQNLQHQLQNSRKYAEGYALQFSITDEKSFHSFLIFIQKLLEKRM